MILFLIGFSVRNHALDFLFRKSRAGLDGNRVFLAGSLVLGRHVQNAVGVDVERHFNLRQSTRRRRNTFEVELAQEFVRGSHFMLALINLNSHRRLVVFSSREHLRMLRRNRRVALDHRGHHAAQRFNAEGKRRHIKEQHITAFTRKHRTLNSSADSHRFIRVDVLAGILAEEFLHDFLNTRHTSHAAHEDNVGDVALILLGVTQSLRNRFNRTLHEVFNKAFEFRTRNADIQMLRTGSVSRDVRQIDFRFLTARELNLGLFSSILQTLQSQNILREIHARITAEFSNQIVNDALIEVFAAEERITVRGKHFKLLVTVNVGNVNDRNIERAAAQVVHSDRAVRRAALVHTKGQCRGGRLIDDALHIQTSNTSGILRRLTLTVIKVGRHRNNGLRHGLAKIILSGLLHLAKHFSGNLLRRKLLAAHFNPRVTVIGANDAERSKLKILLNFGIIKATTDQTLHGEERVLRICDGLAFGGSTHQNFTIVKIGDNRRRRTGAFAVFHHLDVIAFHDGDSGIRRAKVNTDDLCHVS